MKNIKNYDDYPKIPKDVTEETLKTDYITIYNICKQYNISKQTVNRAIASNKINGFMKECWDEKKQKHFILLKWYIKKDEKFEEFILKHTSN